MLAINIVDKESKKIGISADGGVVKVSALQGGLTSRNNPCPCDCMQVSELLRSYTFRWIPLLLQFCTLKTSWPYTEFLAASGGFEKT